MMPITATTRSKKELSHIFFFFFFLLFHNVFLNFIYLVSTISSTTMITILISIAMCNECWGSRPPHLLCYGAQHLVTTKNVQTIWSAQGIVQILIPLIKMLLFIKGINLPERFPKDSKLTEIQFSNWHITII